MRSNFLGTDAASYGMDRIDTLLQETSAATRALDAVDAQMRSLRYAQELAKPATIERVLKQQWETARLRDAMPPTVAAYIQQELERQERWKALAQPSAAKAAMKVAENIASYQAEPTGFQLTRELQEQRAAWHATMACCNAAYVQQEIEKQVRWRALTQPLAFDQAMKAAEQAARCVLPDPLAAHRASMDVTAYRVSALQATDWWQEGRHLNAFVQASAMAEALRSGASGRDLERAMRAFSVSAIPELPSLKEHRYLLDAAGLLLPRWPRVRWLSRSEQRRRFNRRLGANSEPTHVRRAKSLVHRYELELRRAIDWVMAQAFGEDWPQERLPLCDCRDLLGRWRKKGGSVLEHADYAHYARIMSQEEHFKAGFSLAFPDSDALKGLILKAGSLRAASHHPSEDRARFTPQDLRDLRVTWAAIAEGLIVLQPDDEADFYLDI